MNSTVSVRMKRACVVVMVVLAVCSCFAKTSVDRVAALKDRVSEIYTNLYEGELEERYCSEAYLEVYNAVVSADKELDEVGFFDSNHWTSAQDGPDSPVFVVKSMELLSDSVAAVEVREDEMQTGATLRFVWERDNWYVEDFLYPENTTGEVV